MKEREIENKSFLKDKLKQDSFRILNVTAAISSMAKGVRNDVTKTSGGSNVDDESVIDTQRLPEFMRNTSQKDLHIIRRTFYRYRDRKKLKRRKTLKARDSSESGYSMTLTLPSTDVTDLSSNGSGSVHSNHCGTHDIFCTSGPSEKRVASGSKNSSTSTGKPFVRRVSPQ